MINPDDEEAGVRSIPIGSRGCGIPDNGRLCDVKFRNPNLCFLACILGFDGMTT